MITFYEGSPDGQWDSEVVEILKDYKQIMELVGGHEGVEEIIRVHNVREGTCPDNGTRLEWNCYTLMQNPKATAEAVSRFLKITPEEVNSNTEKITEWFYKMLQDKGQYNIKKSDESR